MASTLIVKTGASGDVVRATVLLPALDGDVYWITSAYNKPLFPDDHPLIKELAAIDQLPAYFADINFDKVINLEEDLSTARVAQSFHAKERLGVYLDNGVLAYSASSAPWFDMSLVSVYGKAKANELKYANTKSYQEFLYEMLGKKFTGEKYTIFNQGQVQSKRNTLRIGIEKRSGMVWSNKQWWGYDELEKILETRGYEVVIFQDRPALRQYMEDIQQCDLVICGDTLCMHLALGYELPCISIFNCTSPSEIYSYDLLKKIISPLLKDVFYETGTVPAVINSIGMEKVLQKVDEWEQNHLRD